MAKMLMLRWKPINTGNGIWFDSNLIVLNGTSGVHIESKKSNLDITTFQSMTEVSSLHAFKITLEKFGIK